MMYQHELTSGEKLDILNIEITKKKHLNIIKILFITIGLLPAVITLIGGVIAIIRGEDGAVANLIGGLAVSIVWMIPIGIILPLKVFGSRTNTVNLIVENIGKNNIITAKKVSIDRSDRMHSVNRRNIIYFTDDRGVTDWAHANFECSENRMAEKDCLVLFAKINGTTVALREAYLCSKETAR